MNPEERIETFALLGQTLSDALGSTYGKYSEKLNSLIINQKKINPWFSPDNVALALKNIANELTKENLTKWTDAYPFFREEKNPLKAGLIFAGNIPLAGFHDFLTVLMSGNHLVAKTSSKDPDLIPFLGDILFSINNEFRNAVKFTTDTLSGFDVIIATGSNNSSRYFEYYFSKYPNIIRKNRNSVAVLDGNESSDELEALGKDIFSYFGLGCRNVSKLFLPEGYDIESLPRHWNAYSSLSNHSKYANNYDYNKSIFLVNKQKFFDTGCLLIREENKLSSPVSVLYFEHYSSKHVLEQQIDLLKDNIQCIISRNYVPFGQSQSPHLWDYADGTDTMDFLLKKNLAGIL
jgi:hypothetical protein